MRYRTYMRVVVVLAVFSLFIVGGLAVVGQDSPYLSGLWLQKGVHEDGAICWSLIAFHSDIAEDGVSGTAFGVRPDPMEVPIPEGGTMIMSEEVNSTWKMISPEKYELKALAFIRTEGMVIGMLEMSGTLIKETGDKMSASTNLRIVDLEGNDSAKLPPLGTELTRIALD